MFDYFQKITSFFPTSFDNLAIQLSGILKPVPSCTDNRGNTVRRRQKKKEENAEERDDLMSGLGSDGLCRFFGESYLHAWTIPIGLLSPASLSHQRCWHLKWLFDLNVFKSTSPRQYILEEEKFQ